MLPSHTSLGDCAAAGAVSGAWWGWLLGLCVGVGLPILPDLGLVWTKSSVSKAFVSGIAGGVAGAPVGGIGGVLIGWSRRPKEPGSMDRHR